MAEQIKPFKRYSAECPRKCATFSYKSGIAKEDIRVHCVHCGMSCKIELAKIQ